MVGILGFVEGSGACYINEPAMCDVLNISHISQFTACSCACLLPRELYSNHSVNAQVRGNGIFSPSPMEPMSNTGKSMLHHTLNIPFGLSTSS